MSIPVETIAHDGTTLAIIVRGEFRQPGVRFFTPNELSQQLGYLNHPAGRVIEPHFHNPVPRQVTHTQEVLLIRKGQLRVDFYDTAQSYLESRVLAPGDVILLIAGGHGFEVLDEVEMIEVKQGPHLGDADKTRFPAVAPQDIKIGG